MRTCRNLLCVVALLVLGSMSQVASACVTVYTDHYVDAGQSEVQAWGWVEDTFNTGYCWQAAYSQWGNFAHTYHASVQIVSPTQNLVSDVGGQSNVSWGGGSASAYAAISFVAEPGVYEIDWELWIWCTIGWLIVYESESEDEPVCAPVLDSAAIAVATGWPNYEPWERAVTMWCDVPGVVKYTHFSDSFGQFYGNPTHDPCKSEVVFEINNRVGDLHSHPHFPSTVEYNAGLGCREDTEPRAQWIIDDVNEANEADFSPDDILDFISNGDPIFLKTPSGRVLRRDSTISLLGPPVQVYP